MDQGAIDVLLRRDRLIVAAGLLIIAALAWYYVLTGAGTGMSIIGMTRIAIWPGASGPGMGMPRSWPNEYWLLMTAMWWVMMIAMMVPSAAPMVLLYARTARYAQKNGTMPAGIVPAASFLAGYLLVWLGFSILAVALQFGLEQAGIFSSMMMWSLDPWLSAGVLLAAGLYQLTPWKRFCLKKCRSPAAYLTANWRPGHLGALAMGVRHGAYCVGCCWALMALLFVGGIMNLLWIAGLAVVVLVEKVLPAGERLGRAIAVGLIGAAVLIGVRAIATVYA